MTQFIPLTIYLDTNILIGIASLPDGVRLSDFLNTSGKFLRFTEASTSDGVVEQMNEIYINKEAIKFVRTTNDNDGKGLGNSYYLHVKKIPIRIKMLLNEYELSGNLYSKNAGAISNLFERESMFLPCTEVKMRHISSTLTSEAGFVAINRNKVFRIQTVESGVANAANSIAHSLN